MKTETIHEHAKRIDELYTQMIELARSEGQSFEDYTPRDLVMAAKGILNVMQDWDSPLIADQQHVRRQRRLLRNFVNKWLPTVVNR